MEISVRFRKHIEREKGKFLRNLQKIPRDSTDDIERTQALVRALQPFTAVEIGHYSEYQEVGGEVETDSENARLEYPWYAAIEDLALIVDGIVELLENEGQLSRAEIDILQYLQEIDPDRFHFESREERAARERLDYQELQDAQIAQYLLKNCAISLRLAIEDGMDITWQAEYIITMNLVLSLFQVNLSE